MYCTFGTFYVGVFLFIFFLKGHHEPGASCSESMSIFALYCVCVSEQINDDEEKDIACIFALHVCQLEMPCRQQNVNK